MYLSFDLSASASMPTALEIGIVESKLEVFEVQAVAEAGKMAKNEV